MLEWLLFLNSHNEYTYYYAAGDKVWLHSLPTPWMHPDLWPAELFSFMHSWHVELRAFLARVLQDTYRAAFFLAGKLDKFAQVLLMLPCTAAIVSSGSILVSAAYSHHAQCPGVHDGQQLPLKQYTTCCHVIATPLGVGSNQRKTNILVLRSHKGDITTSTIE